MTAAPTDRARTPDRGTTLVEVVVGLFLVALAAGALAQLMTSTARSAPDDHVDPDVALAMDAFTRDVREAGHVEAEVSRGRIVAVILVSDRVDVRWHLDGDDLRRSDGTGSPRTMAVDLDRTSRFTLLDPDGSSIDASDGDAVRWCTRLVELALERTDWAAARRAALRVDTDPGACP